jgi:gas vesicle protein
MKADSRAVLGFLAGAAIGAIAGILFAPEKGSETRRKISKKTSELGDSLKHTFSDFVDSVKESYTTAKQETEALADKGKSEFKSLKNEVKNAL